MKAKAIVFEAPKSITVRTLELAPMGARDVVGDGKAFGQHQIALGIGGDLALRVNGQKRRRGGVDRRICGQRVGLHPVGLDHWHMGEGQVQFAQKPKRTRGARAVDAVNSDHSKCLSTGLPQLRMWRAIREELALS